MRPPLEGRAKRCMQAMMRLDSALRTPPSQLGLNRSQVTMLMHIAYGAPHDAPPKSGEEAQPIAVGVLAAQMHQSLPTVSQRLSTLETAGYIVREPAPNDRRITLVRLTEKGRAMVEELPRVVSQRINDAFAAMGEEKAETLLALLEEWAALQTSNEGEKTC